MAANELTEEKVRLVTESWALVRTDLKGNGVKLFIALFKAYPEYQKMFKQLADIPLDKLATAPKMRAHGSVVMNNVDAMIDALPEQECIEEIIRKIVVTHAPRKVTPGHFENLFVVMLSFLADALGPAFTAETKEAWVATANTVIAIIKTVEL